jgi:hypothetical protein
VATVASIAAMAAVKTISGDKTFSLSEMCISYVSAARIDVSGFDIIPLFSPFSLFPSFPSDQSVKTLFWFCQICLSHIF